MNLIYPVQAPCILVEVDDVLTGDWINPQDTVSNFGTARFRAEAGRIVCTVAGTAFGLRLLNLFPVIEVGANNLMSETGQLLEGTLTWATQDIYFYEILYGYYDEDFHRAYGTNRVEPGFNNPNCKFMLKQSPANIRGDMLEGPFWFDNDGNPLAKSQSEIEAFCAGKSANFFSPEKGYTMFKEVLTDEEVSDVVDWYAAA